MTRPPLLPAATLPSVAGPWLDGNTQGAARLDRFGTLHETVRLLLIAHGAQSDWARFGVVSLPLASCEEAVQWHSADALECTLIALGDAATAVLVMSESTECDRATCLEQSWVFLSDHRAALPLPPRRAADYGSLRADLSREVAEALWLAGYRGRSDKRVAAAGDIDPYADELPSIASYKSCARSPDGNELVCRSREGAVIGLNPRTSVQRVIAALEREVLRAGNIAVESMTEPVSWTENGELALRLKVQHHPLCGNGPCTLLGLLAWPSVEPSQARFVRVE